MRYIQWIRLDHDHLSIRIVSILGAAVDWRMLNCCIFPDFSVQAGYTVPVQLMEERFAVLYSADKHNAGNELRTGASDDVTS